MKILFIGETGSIHVARWTNQLHGAGWDYRIFHPSTSVYRVRDEFLSGYFYLPHEALYKPDGMQAEYTWSKKTSIVSIVNKILQTFGILVHSKDEERHQALRTAFLAKLIAEWQPDVIHSLGMFVNWQNSSKMLLGAREILGGKLPCPWIVSIWGADLDLYPHLGPTQYLEAEAVMQGCDGILVEGDRDLELAYKFGFHGKALGKLPAYGGITWKAQDYCFTELPSKRRVIILKGRDNTDSISTGGDPQGRAMTAMKAFELCQDVLQDYFIVVMQATPAIEIQAKILSATTNLKITAFPNSMSLPYPQWLSLLGTARILLAVTVSDGFPGTLVDTMSLGVFPIHSGLQTVREWVQDGENGYLVPSEDVHAVAQALRKALGDDSLVDRAGALNVDLISKNLSDTVIRPKVMDMYKSLIHS